MEKIIVARFETMDFAEIAARNIRHKFEGISKIKIQYRHLDESGCNDVEYVVLPPSTMINGSFGNGFPQAYVSADYRTEQTAEHPEKQDSAVVVYADQTVATRIATYLRSLGGLGIKISDSF